MRFRSFFSIVQKGLPFLACLLMFIGLIASKALIAISSAAFGLAALPYLFNKENWKQLRQRWLLFSPSLLFLLLAATATYSTNWEELGIRLRVMLPLLSLPICFAFLPTLPQKQWRWLLGVFVLLISLASLGVLFNYMIHFESIQYALQRSKGMPNPAHDHVRFSLLICWGCFLSGQLFIWKHGRWPALWAILSLFLLLSLHIMGVRSGLLAFYLCFCIYLSYQAIQKKRYLQMLIGYGCLILLPFIAYKTLPSFRKKVHLSQENIRLYQLGVIENYSDTQRMLSLAIGLEVWGNQPLLGVGLGDLKDQQEKIYKQRYPKQRPMYPHSQYITILAASGILGLSCFILFFAGPFFSNSPALFRFFIGLIAISFLTENTLFPTIGANLYAFFYCYLLAETKD